MKYITFLLTATLLFCAANASAQTNLWQASGNIGIGTTSPVDKLDVVGGDWSGLYLRHGATGGWATLKWSPAGVYGTGRFLILSNETPNVFGTGQDGGILFRVNQGPTGGYTYPAMAILQNGNVGIGTAFPETKLHIHNTSSVNLLGDGLRVSRPSSVNCYGFLSYGGGASGEPGDTAYFGSVYAGGTKGRIAFRISDGNSSVDAAVIDPAGNVGIGMSNPATRFEVSGAMRSTDEAGLPTSGKGIEISYQTSSDRGRIIAYDRSAHIFKDLDFEANNYIFQIGNVGIGTTNPTEKLSVNGRIRAKEVIVDTNWSDYVFAKNYKLAPLSEVEQHIKAEGHLPGVPSAQEVAEKGVSIGDMQSILLAKIEELTLHVIAQEKHQIAQDAEISALKAENAQLKK